MELLYNEKKEQSQGVLSAVRPEEPILNINYKKETELQTVLRQKKQLTIYIEDNKYFVEHAAAYALGIVNTRSIMLENPKMVEISYEVHAKLSNNDELEIQYVNVVREKQKLKIFYDGLSFCIESSAAYALGLLTVEEFNNLNTGYYYIDEQILANLKSNYDVEMSSLKISEDNNNKKL